jgi:hypothetical protein
MKRHIRFYVGWTVAAGLLLAGLIPGAVAQSGPNEPVPVADACVCGSSNQVTDDYGTVCGGENNQAGDDAGSTTRSRWATVGGGFWNDASGERAIVGGGSGNLASG